MKNFRKVICFLVFVFITLTVAPLVCYSAEEQQALNEWLPKANMLLHKYDFQTITVDGKIYVMGGWSNKVLNSLEVYEKNNDKWTTLSPMSSGRIYFQTAIIDDKIYAIGGRNESNDSINKVEVYNLSTNKWTSLTPMHTARAYFQTEIINGKIYAMGGIDEDNEPTNTVEVYDPNTNMWILLAPMHTAKSYFQTEVIGEKIYSIGGISDKEVNELEVYDPISNTWTSLAPMSIPRREFQAEVIEGKIYAMGGKSLNKITNTVEVYDPNLNTWTSIASMSIPRYDFQTKNIDGKIYAVGGATTLYYQKTTNSVEVYNPYSNEWVSLKPMTNQRRAFKTEVLDNILYALGGASETYGYTSSVEAYAIESSILPVPTNLTAIADDKQITLTWDSVNGASSYNIKRSETPGGPYTTISSVDGLNNSYIDVDVTNGKTYFYVVSAAVENVNSDNSNEVSATPKDPDIIELLPPTNLSATADNLQITLIWNAADGATSYSIKRSETSGGPYTAISSVTGSATTFTDIDVIKDKTYYYVVSAIVSGTESPNSNEASATLTDTPTIDGNRAILVISFNDGNEKEYDLSAAELDAFVDWYDKRSDGAGKSYYYLPKYSNVKPFISRKEYIKFDNIESFEIKSYNE